MAFEDYEKAFYSVEALAALDFLQRSHTDWGEVAHFPFADDIVIFAETLDKLGQILGCLNESSRRVSLGINLDKTNIMFNNQVMPRSVSVDSTLREVVQDYV